MRERYSATSPSEPKVSPGVAAGRKARTQPKLENERTLAERLLEPCARGFSTPPRYIQSILEEHAGASDYLSLSLDLDKHYRRAEELRLRGAGADTLERYEEEISILTTAKEMLTEEIWRRLQ